MRTKDNLAVEKILECAKAEFMEKGFADASMRTIAEKAGYTTGILYSRFSDKNELFRELVEKGANELYDYFCFMQDEFASFPAQRQKTEMHSYVDGKVDRMVDIIYENFDAFKLIVCKSAGSSYEYYIDKMIDVETKNTVRFIKMLQNEGIKINEVRADLNHILASALFNGMFEVVAHDLPKEDALSYIKQLQYFFNAGWDKILGV
ncbi:TetR/AcrR family transcriptional regulator [Treponema sp.]|uniref:TetR/AcrR family transcriptional regulator n=1 Tax=Treponema sp. TaxID=166 RepID=UPI003F0FDCF6